MDALMSSGHKLLERRVWREQAESSHPLGAHAVVTGRGWTLTLSTTGFRCWIPSHDQSSILYLHTQTYVVGLLVTGKYQLYKLFLQM